MLRVSVSTSRAALARASSSLAALFSRKLERGLSELQRPGLRRNGLVVADGFSQRGNLLCGSRVSSHRTVQGFERGVGDELARSTITHALLVDQTFVYV